MNYPPIYLCDTLAFNLNELIMQDFANAVETVSKMKDLSSCRVFLVNSAAFHKYERHCHTFIFFSCRNLLNLGHNEADLIF